jgi:hypothetical protein
MTILCGRIVRVLDLTGTGAGPGAATEVPVEAPKDVGVGGVVQGPALVPVPVSDFEPAPALVEPPLSRWEYETRWGPGPGGGW